jgi:lipopolysaccharide transport system ATP-binding protein
MATIPDFIIVGTQKGGTSSLYSFLCQHPNIKAAARKEVHYFDTYFEHGISWYTRWFPDLAQSDRTGEVSPFYLFHPHVASSIVKALLSVKIIVLLREPVFRVYSHYQFMYRRRIEALTSEEALAAEEHRTRQGVE